MCLEVISENMNYHNSNCYVSCESEFDSISVPLARNVLADVYVIESDKQEEALELERTVTRLCGGITKESWDYSGVFYTNCFRANKPIMLTSLGFFGPASPSKGPVEYTVTALVEELRRELPYTHERSMSRTVRGPETHRGVHQLDRVICSDGVIFEFFQGSLQMPTLKYTLHNAPY